MTKKTPCEKCGSTSDYKSDDGGCGTCGFWKEKFDGLVRNLGACFVKMEYSDDTYVYQYINFNRVSNASDRSMLGFGGSWWLARNADGTYRVSNNCWSGGHVPKTMEHLIPADRIIKAFNFQCGLQRKWWDAVSGELESNLSIPEVIMARLPNMIAEHHRKNAEDYPDRKPMFPIQDPIKTWEDFLCKSK